MASSGNNNSTGEEEATQLAAQLGKPLKEGERIVGPTRRPDGTLRKPIRIRAGYVPQEEVAIYQSKGALWRKEMESQVGPPGYDPEIDSTSKSKSKSVKRNERKKEKRQQAALERAKNSDPSLAEEKEETEYGRESNTKSESLDSVASQMSQLGLSATTADGKTSSNSMEGLNAANLAVDIDKKIRALKKKIRLTEAQLQKGSTEDLNPEQLEKIKKLEGWREELKLLESEKPAESSAS